MYEQGRVSYMYIGTQGLINIVGLATTKCVIHIVFSVQPFLTAKKVIQSPQMHVHVYQRETGHHGT